MSASRLEIPSQALSLKDGDIAYVGSNDGSIHFFDGKDVFAPVEGQNYIYEKSTGIMYKVDNVNGLWNYNFDVLSKYPINHWCKALGTTKVTFPITDSQIEQFITTGAFVHANSKYKIVIEFSDSNVKFNSIPQFIRSEIIRERLKGNKKFIAKSTNKILYYRMTLGSRIGLGRAVFNVKTKSGVMIGEEIVKYVKEHFSVRNDDLICVSGIMLEYKFGSLCPIDRVRTPPLRKSN